MGKAKRRGTYQERYDLAIAKKEKLRIEMLQVLKENEPKEPEVIPPEEQMRNRKAIEFFQMSNKIIRNARNKQGEKNE